MIYIEEIELKHQEIKNLRFLRTFNKWRVLKLSSLYKFEKVLPTAEDIRRKIENRYLKITCDEGNYLKIPLVKGTRVQYSTLSDDNHKNKNLRIYRNKPSELYIELSEDLVDMDQSHELIKKYIVHEISLSDDLIKKHGIIIILEYKNEGIANNPNYTIETSVAIHSFANASVLYNTIDVSFLALLIYQIIIWIFNKKVDFSQYGYLEIVIIISFISQLIFRTKYIGNTFLNFIQKSVRFFWYKVIMKKDITLNFNRFSEKSFVKEIKNQYKERIKEDI